MDRFVEKYELDGQIKRLSYCGAVDLSEPTGGQPGDLVLHDEVEDRLQDAGNWAYTA